MDYESIQVSNEINLEQLTPADAAAYFALIEDNREYLSEFLPWVHETRSVEDRLAYINTEIQYRVDKRRYGYGIKYNGAPIGHISIMHLQDNSPEIGYWIAQKYSGKGFTTLVVRAITKFAFDELNIKTLTIRADPSNVGSNRVAEKAGYTLMGTSISKDGRELNEWSLAAR